MQLFGNSRAQEHNLNNSYQITGYFGRALSVALKLFMLITFYLALLAKCGSSAAWCALLGLGRGVVFAQVRILSSGRMCECDEESERERGRESESLCVALLFGAGY